MSRSIPPDKKSSLVAGFVLNTLDELEAQEFEQLAASDLTLLEDVAQVQQSLETSYGIEEVAPPPILRDRLLASFSDQPTELAVDRDLSRLQAPLERNRNGLKAVLAALAIALTLSNYLWWQSSRQQMAQVPDPVDSDRQPPTQTYQLDATADGGGTVAVEVDPDTLIGTLTASNLPPISSDQVYVLWTVLTPDALYTADSKSAILTATFTVDSQGNGQKPLSLPAAFEQVESVAALGVTIESAQAPQAHQGTPVLLDLLQS